MAKKRKTRKEEVDADGYPTHPRDIAKNAWFYEYKVGLCVVQELRSPDKKYVGTVQAVIPWKAVAAAVGRHLAAKRH